MQSDPIIAHITRVISRIIAETPLIKERGSWIVAVSGGLDSLVLLHSLAAHQDQWPFHLHIATFDHGWRAESAADAAFVHETAAAWGLNCTIGRMDAPAHTPLGREAAARTARYEFFAQVARQQGADTIATAHHADDQAETILLHLLRGTGTHGLQGMSPYTPLPGMKDLRLVRPLLSLTREDLAAYAQRHSLTPRHDSSNADTRYKRNALRHEIVPQLKQFNPKFTHNLLRLASIAQEEQDYLELQMQRGLLAYTEQTAQRWQVPRDRFWVEHIALQKRYIWQACQTLSQTPQDVSYERIMAAVTMIRERRTGARIEIPGRVIVCLTHVYVIIEQTRLP